MNTYMGNLGLQNFRSFNKRIDLKFKPITLLTGPNNSGKSSISKVLKLLKENINKGDLSSINLGYCKGLSAKNVFNFKSKSRELIISIRTENTTYSNPSIIYPLFADAFGNYRKFDFSRAGLLPAHMPNRKIFTLSYTKDQNSIFNLLWKSFSVEEVQERRRHIFKNFVGENRISIEWDKLNIEIDFEGLDEILKSLGFYLNQQQKRQLEKEIFNYFSNISDFFHDRSSENLGLKLSKNILEFPKIYQNAIINNKGNTIRFYFDKETQSEIAYEVPESSFSSTLSTLIRDCIKIHPQEPKDIQPVFELITNFIDKDKLFDSLPSFNGLDELIRRFVFISANGTQQSAFYLQENNIESLGGIITHLGFNKQLLREIDPFISFWLKEFEIGDSLSIETISSGSQVSVYRDHSKININDLGFGSVQLISLILNIVLNPEKVVILEEPEANLHPKLQSKLADLIIDCSLKLDIQFIVETHSEYIIRKLQYWVANKTIGNEDVIIHYLGTSEQNSMEGLENTEILINKDGSLEGGFGPGFFDEATNIQFELLKLNQQQAN